MIRATVGVPEAPVRPSGGILRDMRVTITAPGPLLLAAIFGCYSLQYLGVMGFLPTILIEREGLSPLAASELGALAIAMNGVGNLAGGLLLQRGAARWLLIVLAAAGMGTAALGIFLVPLPFWALYALYLVFSGVSGMLPASVLGAAPLMPRRRISCRQRMASWCRAPISARSSGRRRSARSPRRWEAGAGRHPS